MQRAFVHENQVATVIVWPNGQPEERLGIFREPLGFQFQDNNYPASVFRFSEQQLLTFGLWPIETDEYPNLDEVMITGSTFEVDVSGKRVLEHWTVETLDPQVLAQRLDEAKRGRCNEVDELLAVKCAEGFGFGGNTYQVSERDMIRVIGAGLVASIVNLTAALQQAIPGFQFPAPVWPADFKWIDKDNDRNPMNSATAMAFGFTAFGVVSGLIFKSRDHKDAINALTTLEDVREYDITTGW